MSHHGQAPEDNLHSSWVELHYSQSSSSRRSSVGGGLEHMPSSSSQHQGDMEQILLDAQLESDRNSSSDSPPLVMRPKTAAPRAAPSESGSSADHTSTQLEEDGQERAVEVESMMLKSSADWIWDWSSRPENLPPKEFLFQHPKQTGSLSMRKARMMKKGILSSEFLVIFFPSIVVSHLLTLGLGIYIGKRLAASTASTL